MNKISIHFHKTFLVFISRKKGNWLSWQIHRSFNACRLIFIAKEMIFFSLQEYIKTFNQLFLVMKLFWIYNSLVITMLFYMDKCALFSWKKIRYFSSLWLKINLEVILWKLKEYNLKWIQLKSIKLMIQMFVELNLLINSKNKEIFQYFWKHLLQIVQMTESIPIFLSIILMKIKSFIKNNSKYLSHLT